MARSRFSGFNEQLIADFRAHGGKATSGPFVGRDLLLLTTKGAKSGTKRTTPVAPWRRSTAACHGATPVMDGSRLLS